MRHRTRARAATDGPAFLAGQRVRLRPLALRDANGVYLAWLNDPEVRRYLTTGSFPVTLKALRRYVTERINRPDILFLAICDRRSGRHVGNIKLEPINWIYRTATLGLMIGDRRAWGRGYATEAIRLVVRHSFDRLNLRKVSAGLIASHVGSLRAFRKAGFVVEARHRGEVVIDGRPVDTYRLAIFRGGRRG